MIATSCSSPQITDTQDMISSLETILLDREHDDGWYTIDRFKWTKLLGCSESVLLGVFFPVEVLEVFKRDNSHEELAQRALSKGAAIYEGESEVASVYSFYYGLSPSMLSGGTFFHIRFTESFNRFLDSFVSKVDFYGGCSLLLAMRRELKKMDHMFFLSHEMMRSYFEKYCPNLNNLLDSWKLVNRLERCKDEVSVCYHSCLKE